MGQNARRYLQDHFTLRSAAESYFDLITETSRLNANNKGCKTKES